MRVCELAQHPELALAAPPGKAVLVSAGFLPKFMLSLWFLRTTFCVFFPLFLASVMDRQQEFAFPLMTQ